MCACIRVPDRDSPFSPLAWATALTYASAGASSLEVDLASAASQQLPVSPTEDEPATFLQLDYLPGSDDAHAFAQAADAAVGAPEDMTAVHTQATAATASAAAGAHRAPPCTRRMHMK